MPFHGHVAPMAAVARAFVEAGHGVRVYTGSAHAERFTAVGAQVLTWTSAPDFDEHDLAATFPVLRGRKGPRQMLANVEHVFVRTAAAQSDDLVRAFDERPWDVIVADGLSLGAHLASERTRTPWVTVSIVPLAIPSRDLPPPMFGLAPSTGALGRLRDRALRAVAQRGRARHPAGLRRGARTRRPAAERPLVRRRLVLARPRLRLGRRRARVRTLGPRDARRVRRRADPPGTAARRRCPRGGTTSRHPPCPWCS